MFVATCESAFKASLIKYALRSPALGKCQPDESSWQRSRGSEVHPCQVLLQGLVNEPIAPPHPLEQEPLGAVVEKAGIVPGHQTTEKEHGTQGKVLDASQPPAFLKAKPDNCGKSASQQPGNLLLAKEWAEQSGQKGVQDQGDRDAQE